MKPAHSRPVVIQTYAEAQAFNAGVEAMRAASLTALKAHRSELRELAKVLVEMGKSTGALRLIAQSVAFGSAAAVIDGLTAPVGDVP